jgi:hypothetical protein
LEEVASSYLIAPEGQIFAQLGSPPHRLHLTILFVTALTEIFPIEQALTHILQPIHFLGLETTAPFSSLEIAPTGHTFMQAGSSHCMHIMGTEIAAFS